MAEGFIVVNTKNAHTWQRTVSATLVEDEFTLPGEFPYPSYTVSVESISGAVANDHILQIMAGAALNVAIRSLRLEQVINATAAGFTRFQILRLTTAGTGGTAVTPQKMDPGDAAAGATAMTLPTVKGAEGAMLAPITMLARQAIAATGAQTEDRFIWTSSPGMKPIRIAAGVANGIALKVITATAASTWTVYVELVELNFS